MPGARLHFVPNADFTLIKQNICYDIVTKTIFNHEQSQNCPDKVVGKATLNLFCGQSKFTCHMMTVPTFKTLNLFLDPQLSKQVSFEKSKKFGNEILMLGHL
jgi:hypothetical protein